jgi:hypothetical protein
LWGTFIGPPAAFQAMDIEVSVVEETGTGIGYGLQSRAV